MEPPDAVRSAPIAMTETSFLFIVPFLASMTNLPCCRVPAQLSMAYKEIFPCLASLTLCCGALPAITASGALLLPSQVSRARGVRRHRLAQGPPRQPWPRHHRRRRRS